MRVRFSASAACEPLLTRSSFLASGSHEPLNVHFVYAVPCACAFVVPRSCVAASAPGGRRYGPVLRRIACLNFTWFLHVDMDTAVNVPMLLSALLDIDGDQPLLMGQEFRASGISWVSGFAFLVSKLALGRMRDCLSDGSVVADGKVAECARRHGVAIVDLPGFSHWGLFAFQHRCGGGGVGQAVSVRGEGAWVSGIRYQVSGLGIWV